jgi:hypothetical protein
MSNGEPTALPAPDLPADNLYHVLEGQVLADFDATASELIRAGYEPLGGMTSYNVGSNAHYLQAFWRPQAVASLRSNSPKSS